MRLAPLGLLLFSCAVYDRSLLGDGGTSGEGGACSGAKMQCGKTCVDTATDPKNCGACGHDCVEGKCVNGACQQQCLTDNDCAMGYACNMNACEKQATTTTSSSGST